MLARQDVDDRGKEIQLYNLKGERFLHELCSIVFGKCILSKWCLDGREDEQVLKYILIKSGKKKVESLDRSMLFGRLNSWPD